MLSATTPLSDPYILYTMLAYIGFVAGFFGSMLGLGGGWLVVPALQVLGVSPIKAVGTSLTAMIFTSLVGALGYHRKRILLIGLGTIIGLPALGGVYAGKQLLSLLNEYGYSGPVLVAAFIILLGGLGLSMLFSSKPKKHAAEKKVRWQPIGPALNIKGERKIGIINVAVLGYAAGVLSGLLGIGGGILLTPAMVTFFGVPVVQAASASLISVLFSSLLGSSLYIADGNSILGYALALAAATSTGSYVGSLIAPRISEPLLKKVFGTLTLLTAAALLVRELGEPLLSVVGILIGATILLLVTFMQIAKKNHAK